jgi:hypothetical protein
LNFISVDGAKQLTLKEAKASPDWPEYEKAMLVELQALNDNQTWDHVIYMPTGRLIVGYTWTFTKKVYEVPVRYKARLCAQGFSQVHGLDYFDTFSPVIRQTSLRTIISMASAEGMHLHKLDVATAFLHGTIDVETYMKAPEQLGLPSGAVLRLNKAIYGLKQASRIWNTTLNDFMSSLAFSRCIVDPCIYTKGSGQNKIINRHSMKAR